VANPDQDGDASKNAPDPEADEREDPTEGELQQRLLLSFSTCILEAYVNGNSMAWAARLLEFYNPAKVVPGRRTLMAAFRKDQELLERDAIVGKLVVSVYPLLDYRRCRTKKDYLAAGFDRRPRPRLVLQDFHSPAPRRANAQRAAV
jgi:hypothetical protein